MNLKEPVRMESVYSEAKKKIKALQDLNKHPISEVISWVIEAMDVKYPPNRKRAFEIVTKRSWSDIRVEVIQTVTSQKFEDIHKLRSAMIGLDLLFNKELLKSGLIIDGSLAVFSRKSRNIALFTLLPMISEGTKDTKLETYLLYRYFMGEPKLSNGFLQKF
jgi:hypothetical protein